MELDSNFCYNFWLSPPSRLSSPSPNYRKDDDVVDVDVDGDDDVADGDGDYGDDVVYDSEEERWALIV